MDKDEEILEDEHHENKSDPFTLEEDIRMWEFLHRFAYDLEEEIPEKFHGPSPHTNKFWKTFVNETDSHREPSAFRRHFPKLMKSLHKMPFGTEMKLNLYYSLDITVPDEFTEDAWRFAKIWLNKDGTVESFEMKTYDEVQRDCEEEERIMAELRKKEIEKLKKEEMDALKERRRQRVLKREEQKAKMEEETVSAVLKFVVDSVVNSEIAAAKKKKTPKKRRVSKIPNQQSAAPTIQNQPETPPVKRRRLTFSEEDDVKMWMYLHAKLRASDFDDADNEPKLKPTSVKLWREFLGDSNDKNLVNALCHHYSAMSHRLHKMPFDMIIKTKLYYGLHIPVESGFLERLKRLTEVEVDENGYILDYGAFHYLEEKKDIKKENAHRSSRLSMY